MKIPKFAYEPQVLIKTVDEEFETKDINNFAIYKFPFTKISSFASMTLSMELNFFSKVDDDIRLNKYPVLYLKMNLASEERENERTFNTMAAGFTNRYRIILASTREEAHTDSYLIPVTLYLANETLFELTQHKSYNKLLANKTSMNVLTDYENHINENFGKDTTFKFQKYLGDENNFTYKQLLIRTKSDLLVPYWIVNNTKPSHGLTYYFFDDFIPVPNFGLINGMLMTLSKSNIKKLESIDTTDERYADIELRSQLLNQHSISDIGGALLAENPTLVIADKSNKTVVRKGNTATVRQTSLSSTRNDELMGRSISNYIYNDSDTSSRLTSHGLTLYACDNVDNAERRFNLISELIKNDIEYLATYETKEIHFDAIQLFRTYKMTPLSTIEYLYLPISIVNIFRKYSKRETLLQHGAKFQFLVYKN